MRNYSNVVWLYHAYIRKLPVLQRLDELLESQWMPPDQIAAYQLAQVRDLIRYAGERSPYYRSLFKEIGLAGAEDIRTLADLGSIPPLTKTILRTNLDALTVQRDDLEEYQTGGSTGTPIRFYGNSAFLSYDKPAAGFRAYSFGGYRPGDSIAKIWGFDESVEGGRFGGLAHRSVYRRHELNSFSLTPQRIQDFLDTMNRKRIAFVRGYATSLTDLARFMIKHNAFPSYPVRAVFSEAERLDEYQREFIETAFRSRVFNYYGCREFGTIGIECDQHNGLHENFEQLLTEVLPDGRILVTSFRNRGTIFLRYEIGDNAEGVITEPCRCGRASTRLTKILGRESDDFVAPDGTLVHGEYVTHLFYNTRAVEQFQMVQNGPTDFTLSVVSKDPASARDEIDGVISRLNAKFNASLSVHVKFVEEIQKTQTGKRKFTICKMSA